MEGAWGWQMASSGATCRAMLWIACLALISAPATAEVAQTVEYPNPRLFPHRCGRGGLKISNVCDPHDIFGKIGADRIDMVARYIDSHGPKMGVVGMLKSSETSTLNWGCSEGSQLMATELLKKWKFDGLILLSRDDKQICFAESIAEASRADVEQVSKEVREMLEARGQLTDRTLDHAVTYALIRIAHIVQHTALPSEVVEKPSVRQHMQMMLAHMLPFIGFGITDNGLMIIFGEAIDEFLGQRMRLSTMGAAATGNLLSDTAGVFFGGSIQNLANVLGANEPDLTNDQRRLSSVRWSKMIGEAVGVALGCWVGMIPLLFVDHIDASDDLVKDPSSVPSDTGLSAT